MWREMGGTFLMAGAFGLPDPAGAQCTHVPNEYWRRVGAGQLFGIAASWMEQTPIGCVALPLTDGLVLLAGDVVVFRPETVGVDGHVDVVLDGSRRPWLGMDQNWPLGSPVSRVWHSRQPVGRVLRVES